MGQVVEWSQHTTSKHNGDVATQEVNQGSLLNCEVRRDVN